VFFNIYDNYVFTLRTIRLFRSKMIEYNVHKNILINKIQVQKYMNSEVLRSVNIDTKNVCDKVLRINCHEITS